MDKDCPLGIEVPVDGELFGKPGKLRARLARAKERRHNQQWSGPDDREPESNRMDVSHTTVELETVTAERKQHALELETMRQKYEAWTKKAEDLAYENEVLKKSQGGPGLAEWNCQYSATSVTIMSRGVYLLAS